MIETATGLSSADQDRILDFVRALLSDPQCTVEMNAGMREVINGRHRTYIEYEYDGSRSITIAVPRRVARI